MFFFANEVRPRESHSLTGRSNDINVGFMDRCPSIGNERAIKSGEGSNSLRL
jgi:hypothetical protein